jgi:hypothetical protein
MRTTVFAVILLLLETVCAIFDNVCASAHSTVIGFLDHVPYLTITYFSSTTEYLSIRLHAVRCLFCIAGGSHLLCRPIWTIARKKNKVQQNKAI